MECPIAGHSLLNSICADCNTLTCDSCLLIGDHKGHLPIVSIIFNFRIQSNLIISSLEYSQLWSFYFYLFQSTWKKQEEAWIYKKEHVPKDSIK